MSRFPSIPLVFCALGALVPGLAGCGGGSDPANPDAGGDDAGADAPPAGDDVTIQEVQSASTPDGAPVTLRGVVVVAIDTFGDRTGNVYVMEPDGGEFSGVVIFGATGAGIAPGDLVDVVGGVKDEFALSSDTSGRTLTEIVAPQGGRLEITRVGQGQVPAPVVLDPADLAASDDEAEKWESVLIAFEGVPVEIGPFQVSGSDVTLKEMLVAGPFRVGGSLADLGDSLARNVCLTSLVGVGDYFFEYKLLPRDPGDFTVGTGCAALPASSSVAVQSDAVAVGEIAGIDGAIVTAVDESHQHVWIQDEDLDASHNGLVIFSRDGSPMLPIAIGDRVSVSGFVSDFQGERQLFPAHVAVGGGTGTVQVLSGADIATLGALATGAPFEGAVVRFEDVTIANINPDAPSEFGRFSILGPGGDPLSPLHVDDVVLRNVKQTLNLAAGQCLSSITGVVVFNHFDNEYNLSPRRLEDVDATPCGG